jgi:adenine-specific DNA-methyltransferase
MPTLQWLGREEAVLTAEQAPFRLLEYDATLSAGDADAGNLLIQGDNLDALKAILPVYAGRVKCIYIDPPYNTHSAFEHYDDNLEHSTWLSMIYPRFELLREFLSEDGSIWISIDDSEAQYAKIILDEIFGRKHFIATNVWQKRYSRENREAIGDVHEYIYVYAMNPDNFKNVRNRIPPTDKQKKVYKNPNNDPRGPWRPIPMTAQGYRPNQMYKIVAPGGKSHVPPEGRCWSTVKGEFTKLRNAGRIYFGKDENSQPNIIRYLSEVDGFVPWTWWPSDEVGHTDESKKEMHALLGKDNAFATPKPERLIQRILQIATNPGDLVLDSFLGSGTTAAVAHKMGRRYIGIEMGDHAVTHCVPRLRKVVDGEQGGISKAVEWQGGGGFRFMRLGPAIFDETGVLNPAIRFPDLAAHIWFSEIHSGWNGKSDSPLLGIHKGTAYYLLFNGILGDRRPEGGNVLNTTTFKMLPEHDGPKVIYGEWSQWRGDRLRREGITFKMIPYEIKVR